MSPFYVNLSGIRSGEDRLNVVAHNLANLTSSSFSRSRITHQELQPPGGVSSTVQQLPNDKLVAVFNEGGDTLELTPSDIGEDIISGLIASHTVSANVKAAQTADSLLGIVLDLKA